MLNTSGERVYPIAALLSLLGSLGCYLIQTTDILLSYEFLIILGQIAFVFIFLVFLVLTQTEIIQRKKRPDKFLLFLTITVLVAHFLLYGSQNGLLWGSKLLDTTFFDDRGRLDLRLYQNGKYIINAGSIISEERDEGFYRISNDTIVLSASSLVGEGYIATEIVIDRAGQKIYFKRQQDGTYDTSFFYFKINSLLTDHLKNQTQKLDPQ